MDHEEGIATGFLKHEFRQWFGAVLLNVGCVANKFFHIMASKRCKNNLVQRRSRTSDRLQRAVERVRCRDFVVSICSYDQEVLHVRLGDQMFK